MALRQLIGRRYLSVRLSNRILGLKPPSQRCLLRTSAHKHATNQKGEVEVTSALLSSKFSDFARSLVEEESQKEAKMEIIRDLNKCLKLKGFMSDFGLVAVGNSKKSQKQTKTKIIRDWNRFLKLEGVDFGLVAKGSSVNGFGMKDSDLDLCMVIDPSRDTFVVKKKLLYRFGHALRCYNKEGGQVANIELVGRAKVPIAKFDVRGIPCDVSFNNMIGIR